MKTINKILLAMGIFISLFIVTMIVTFWVKGEVPDTLIQYTLGAGGVEALLCAVIKSVKVLKCKEETKEECEDDTDGI